MKKILVHAYCKQNIGDDMFVLSLADRYPDVLFYIRLEDEFKKAFEDRKNIIRIDKNDPKTRLRYICCHNRILNQLSSGFLYNGFVKIGGSIFMEPLNWEKKKPFSPIIAKVINKKKFVIGANFGPYYTQEFLERAKSSLKYYRGVCFRDKYSANLFEGIKSVNFAPDILFGGYKYPEPQNGYAVGISVIKPVRKLLNEKFAEKYYETIADVCSQLVKSDIHVKLLGFCRDEGDDEAIEHILEKMCDTNLVESVIYDGNVDQMLSEMNDCEYIIASRFHAMIFGFAMNKKVLPAIYSIKQKNVLEDCGFNGMCWNLLDEESPSPEFLIEKMMGNPVLYNLNRYVIESEGQFVFLDDFLGGSHEK